MAISVDTKVPELVINETTEEFLKTQQILPNQIYVTPDDDGSVKIDVDTELSTTSENPVQNKVITNELNNKLGKLEYKEPAESNTNLGLTSFSLTNEGLTNISLTGDHRDIFKDVNNIGDINLEISDTYISLFNNNPLMSIWQSSYLDSTTGEELDNAFMKYHAGLIIQSQKFDETNNRLSGISVTNNEIRLSSSSNINNVQNETDIVFNPTSIEILKDCSDNSIKANYKNSEIATKADLEDFSSVSIIDITQE